MTTDEVRPLGKLVGVVHGGSTARHEQQRAQFQLTLRAQVLHEQFEEGHGDTHTHTYALTTPHAEDGVDQTIMRCFAS